MTRSNKHNYVRLSRFILGVYLREICKKKVGHDIIYEGNKFTKKNKKSNGIKIKIYFPETGIVHIQVSVLFSTQEKIWEYTRFLIIIT